MYNFGRSRYISFKEYNQDQLFFVPPSLHDFLPEGPLARVVQELVRCPRSIKREAEVERETSGGEREGVGEKVERDSFHR